MRIPAPVSYIQSTTIQHLYLHKVIIVPSCRTHSLSLVTYLSTYISLTKNKLIISFNILHLDSGTNLLVLNLTSLQSLIKCVLLSLLLLLLLL